MKRRSPLEGMVLSGVVGFGLLVSAAAWYLASFVECVPIVAVGSDFELVDAPELRTPEFNRAFAKIARGYGFDVEQEGDAVPRIRRTLAISRDMLWNLTMKAQSAVEKEGTSR